MTPSRARPAAPIRGERPTPGTRLALGLILAAGLALRLWGIGDRLPDPTLGVDPFDDTTVDETDRRAMLYSWDMWRGGTTALNLNPATGDWPGMSFYLTLGLQMSYRGWWAASQGNPGAAAFARHVQADPAAMFLFARVFNALIGVLTILVTYRVGARLAGPGVGLVAALLLSLNPFHVLISQRVSDPNLLALLFLLLALLFLIRFLESPRAAYSALAGAMIGFAGACKYVPLVAILALVGAHWSAAPRRAARVRAPDWESLAAGLAACAAAFFIASPFTILDWRAKSLDFALQRGRLLGDWVGQSRFPIALPTYLTETLPNMMGWPAYLLAAGGCVLLCRRGAKGWIVASVPLLLLAANGMLALAQERFMLPALAALEIAAACALARSAASIPSAAVAVVALIAVAWPMPSLIATRRALALEDTRHVARRWIEASIPAAEPMGFDLYGPAFKLAPRGRSAIVWPFLASQTPLVRIAYHPEWLDGVRYYTTSSEVTRRFEADRERYPTEAAFYGWIRAHGRRLWASGSPRASGPTIEVWELPDTISTPEERDRLWSRAGSDSVYTVRVARWCSEMAQVFLWRDDYPRAGEWAERGIAIGPSEARIRLFETLTLVRLRLGETAAAEESARRGLETDRRSALLHLYRGMALEAMVRPAEALEEYRAALPLCPNEQAAGVVRAAIQNLEAARR